MEVGDMKRWLIGLAALGLLTACSSDGGTIPDLGSAEPVVGHADIPATAFAVEEAALTGAVDGDRVLLTLPVTRKVEARVTGTAKVTLLDLEDHVLATGSSAFTLADPSTNVVVSFPASALPAPGADEASAVVRYELTSKGQRTVGHKSLLTILPKTDLRARLPDRLLVETGAKVRVFAVDPWDGTPVAHEAVRLELYAADDGAAGTGPTEPIVVTGETDDDGSAVLDLPAQDHDGAYYFQATAGDQWAAAFVESDVDVERASRVLVTTDKPIYQPGQTMHLRALALRRPSLNAEGDAPITFEVYDGKGNMVFRKYETTNAFGVAGTDFKLATQVNMGHYQIKAIVGETVTQKTVEVDRYVLPKFKVAVSLDKAFYLVGQKIEGVVDARYFFGKAVAGQVSVVATTYDVSATDFAQVEGSFNADGLFAFTVQLPSYLVGQPVEGGNGVAVLKISATDSAGHTEELEKALVVAEGPIDLVAVPESGGIVPGLENYIYVFATDPLNTALDATLTVSLDDGGDVTPEKLGRGVWRFAVTPEGAVAFHASASLASGESAGEAFTFTPGAADQGLLVRTARSLYRVGDAVDVQVFSTGAGNRVFIDVVKDGQTMLTETLEAQDGLAQKTLDLDPGLVGDVLIEAYQVSPGAEIQRDKKLIFVQDARALDVKVTADKDSYRPGEDATLTFEVTDAQGNPTVAAVGVQIVDEAVFAITENKPGLLETYFQVQEALAEPRYEIHGFDFPLTPVLTSDPTDDLNQARAEASFAALDTSAADGFKSSWAQLEDAVPGVVSPSHQANLEQVKTTLTHLVDAGTLTATNAETELAHQTIFRDAWGNAYTFTVSSDWQGTQATMTSMGPDEKAGTWDDWSATFYVIQEQWAWDDVDFDGEVPAANAGGGVGRDEGTTSGGGEATEGPRVRKDFPETLYYNPALITGTDGKADVSLTMADSITEWRVSTLANSAQGALGSSASGVTVFQEFFVDIDFPATLTRGDEVTFPVALYNYLETPQTVQIQIEEQPWFELTGAPTRTLTLGAGEVTSVSFPVRVLEVGWHALTVVGTGTTLSDAVQRLVQIIPDGTEVRESAGGMLEGSTTHTVGFPGGIVPGSGGLIVKIYPGILAQAVEGLDSMLRMPSGCFEQTTSTNWPNTLVADYLRSSGQTSPEIELKAVDFLQQGYQRLLTFECTGGGFVWFGDPSPANVVLSAMGVLEFSDMARVLEVDPAVISRTATWLVGAQAADGHWHTDQGSEFATVTYDDTKTTAFAAWALAESGLNPAAVDKALQWLGPKVGDSAIDSYSLAMAANAFANGAPDASTTSAVLAELADRAVVGEDGTVHWEYEGSSYNYGSGNTSGVSATSIEVTALAAQAFMRASAHMDLVQGTIGWLAGNKDSLGNWGTTHATILTLRAMVKSLQNKTEEGDGVVTVSVDGTPVRTLSISEENRNVFHQIDLSDVVSASAESDVTVAYEGTGRLMYQVVWNYWMPGDALPPVQSNSLDIAVAWDKTQLEVSDIATCTATVQNLTGAQLDMVMVDLGVPPGFTVLTDKLDEQVASGAIMKYELPGQQVSFYLDKIPANGTVQLVFDAQAKYPLNAQATGSVAYLYYDTDTRSETEPVAFDVTE
ncbi:MAG: hypothetical protein EP329_21160 [Deltaproteobacteria bacterium]|nr:MAG: hypothetical protein EP329_21160 [Deltaproteobacteria bacterium]